MLLLSMTIITAQQFPLRGHCFLVYILRIGKPIARNEGGDRSALLPLAIPHQEKHLLLTELLITAISCETAER